MELQNWSSFKNKISVCTIFANSLRLVIYSLDIFEVTRIYETLRIGATYLSPISQIKKFRIFYKRYVVENFAVMSRELPEARRAFRIIEIFSLPFGVWPLFKNTLFLRFRQIFGIFQMIYLLVISLYEAYLNCDQEDADLVKSLIVFAYGILCLSKLSFYMIHQEKIRTNVASAIRDWSSLKMRKYHTTMRRYERIYKFVTFVYVPTGLLAGGVSSLKVFFSDPRTKSMSLNATVTSNRKFVFPSTCQFNDVSDLVYAVIIVTQLYQILANSSLLFAYDGAFAAVATHLCGQFEILRLRFERLKDNGDSRKLRVKLKELVQRHQHLHKLASLLEEAYSSNLAVQLCMSVTIITVSGTNFLIALRDGHLYDTMQNLAIMNFTIVQCFIYTYIGDNLTHHSRSLVDTIYAVPWYELSNNLRKDLVLVMVRANYSIYLTAGHFVQMTHSTFTDVVKLAASYLSVMRILIGERNNFS